MFAIVITGGFFLLVEGALALLGFGVATDTSDPFVGFSRQIPLLEEYINEDGVAEVRTARNKLIWFNDQQFSIQKAANTKRVFCVGGSTTYGRPYEDSTAFSGWLRELLPLADDSNNWEVINAGGVSYASYRVAAVMEELAEYEPDMFIVYTGQNEFLERRTYANMFDQSPLKVRITSALSRTRTWTLISQMISRPNKPTPDESDLSTNESSKSESIERLPGEVDEMLNHTVGPADYHRDDDWRAKVLHHYKVNLQRMVAIAQGCGAEIVFVAPASNEKNCSPFKSELKSDITSADRNQFNQWHDDASDASANGNDDDSIKLLAKTKTIDSKFADVDYELGRLLFRLEKTQQAGEAFRRSLDHDVCPLRAPSEFLASLRSVAKRNGVSLVDFPTRLRELCFQEHGHRILGTEYFLDHVHPTIAAHRHLAVWIIEQLRSDSLIEGVELTQANIDVASTRVMAKIDPLKQAVAMRNLAKVLHWAGKFDEALPRTADALSTIKNDAESLLVRADCLRQTGQVEEAVENYELLFKTSPLYIRGYMPYGELLIDLGDLSKARDYLTMATLGLVVESPQQMRSQYLLGMTHEMLGEHQQAAELLQNMDGYFKTDANRLFYLAQAKAGLGEEETAIDLYKELLATSPKDVEALNNLAELLIKANRPQQAIAHLKSAIAIDPDNERAKANLSRTN